MMRSVLSLILGALVLAGCQGMSEGAFASRLGTASSEPSPFYAADELTRILAYESLTPDQEIRVRKSRADLRAGKAYNLIGAIEDYDAIIALDPQHPVVPEVRSAREAAINRRRAIENEMEGLQTLPRWFDHTFELGRHAEAAQRYRNSGIAPNEFQVFLLKESGYLCRTDGEDGASFDFETDRRDLRNIVWCTPDPVVPVSG